MLFVGISLLSFGASGLITLAAMLGGDIFNRYTSTFVLICIICLAAGTALTVIGLINHSKKSAQQRKQNLEMREKGENVCKNCGLNISSTCTVCPRCGKNTRE